MLDTGNPLQDSKFELQISQTSSASNRNIESSLRDLGLTFIHQSVHILPPQQHLPLTFEHIQINKWAFGRLYIMMKEGDNQKYKLKEHNLLLIFKTFLCLVLSIALVIVLV